MLPPAAVGVTTVRPAIKTKSLTGEVLTGQSVRFRDGHDHCAMGGTKHAPVGEKVGNLKVLMDARLAACETIQETMRSVRSSIGEHNKQGRAWERRRESLDRRDLRDNTGNNAHGIGEPGRATDLDCQLPATQ